MTNTLLVIEGLVILLLGILVAGLLKSHAEILRELHRLGGSGGGDSPRTIRPTGFEKAPAMVLEGVTVDGSAVAVSLDHGRGLSLLAFLSSGCSSCRAFWTELAGDFELPTPDTRPVIVTKGPGSESPTKIAEMAPPQISVIMSDQAWDDFQVPATPYFQLIDGAGMIVGEGAASTWPQLVDLLRQSIDDNSPVNLDTKGREHFTDSQLSNAGVRPGDPSLYTNPLEVDE